MHVNFRNFKFYVRWQGSSIVQLETNHKYSCFTFLHLKSFWLGYVCLYLDFREKKGTIIAVQQWPPSKAGLGYARRQCWWNRYLSSSATIDSWIHLSHNLFPGLGGTWRDLSVQACSNLTATMIQRKKYGLYRECILDVTKQGRESEMESNQCEWTGWSQRIQVAGWPLVRYLVTHPL